MTELSDIIMLLNDAILAITGMKRYANTLIKSN